MTDLDRMLAHSADFYLLWFEQEKERKVKELISLYRERKELEGKTAEIVVLHDLQSALKAKQEQSRKAETKGIAP